VEILGDRSDSGDVVVSFWVWYLMLF